MSDYELRGLSFARVGDMIWYHNNVEIFRITPDHKLTVHESVTGNEVAQEFIKSLHECYPLLVERIRKEAHRAGVQEERERCAKIAEGFWKDMELEEHEVPVDNEMIMQGIAKKIREAKGGEA